MPENNLFIEKNLPKPLTEEEFKKYMEASKIGDELAREKLIIHNIRLVTNEVFKKFYNTQIELKDLISIGIIGLIKSVDSFNIEKNAFFSTYAIKCIDNEILMFLEKSKKNNKNTSLETPISLSNEGLTVPLKSIIPDNNIDLVEEYEQKEERKTIQEIISRLTPKEQEIIKQYFGFDSKNRLNQSEIAENLNVSQSYLSRLIKQILEKIKKSMTEEEKTIIFKNKKKKKL